MKRREFLKKALQATALSSLPNVLANCGYDSENKSRSKEYLIISSDSLYPIANELTDFHKADYNMEHLKVSDILSTPDNNQLRNFLLDYAHSNPDLKHILLVGDTKTMPTFFETYSQSLDQEVIPTDFYYSNIKSNGNLPDISIGRIPVYNPADLETVIDKIKSFAPRKINKVLLFGTGNELEVMGNRHLILLNSRGYSAKLIKETGNIQNDLTNVINEMNNDTDAAIHYGHSTRFLMYPFTGMNLPKIEGSNFILLSAGCDVMNFSEPIAPDENISENLSLGSMFLKGKNGSISSLGTTKLGGYGYDYSFIDGFFNKQNQVLTLGDLFLKGIRYESNKVIQDTTLSEQEKNALISTMGSFPKRATLLGNPALKLIV